MELTKSNFHEQLDTILQSINSCDFMAIDGEFTGLDIKGADHAAPFDTPEERYRKVRYSSTDFLLIQYGLCTFHTDKAKQRYEARPYNFYVFPRPHSRNSPDRRFLCQSSSIDFLASHGFDFNKLFREGIPYLMPEEEEKLQNDLKRRHEEANKSAGQNLTSPANKMTVPEEQKDFIMNILNKISSYLDSDEEEPLALPSFNAFQRRLVYQSIEERFPNVFVETVTGEKKERFMKISRLKEEGDRQKKEKEKLDRQKFELDLQVGFSKVIQAITQSGKLVVGHNMFLDVTHSVNQFHSALPEDLEGFKALVKTLFPRLLDTKLMAATYPFKEYMLSTSLEEVKCTVNQSPFLKVNIDFAEGYESYSSGGALHEAGYDAYITGSNFAHMTRFLGTFQDPIDDFLLPTSPAIEPFVNKLFLMRINDIPYMNLNGPDLVVNRDHIFHVTFPSEWKATDLFTLFNPFGNIQISWLNDTSAYVGLHRKENAKKALKALSKENRNFHVVSYASHQRTKSYKWSENGTPQTVKRKSEDKPEYTPSKKPLLSNSILSPSAFKDSMTDCEKSTDKSVEDFGERLTDNGGGDTLNKNNDPTNKTENKMFEEAEDW